MSWITENPWPLILVLGVFAAFFVFLWSGGKRFVHLALAGGMLALGLAVFAVERNIVTDSERVEHNVVDMAHAFQRKDLPALLTYFSPNEPELQAALKDAAEKVAIQNDLRISDLEVQMFSQNSRAVSRFRASATVSHSEFGNVGYHPSRWELTWQKEGDAWRIIKLDRVDISNGSKVPFYSAR